MKRLLNLESWTLVLVLFLVSWTLNLILPTPSLAAENPWYDQTPDQFRSRVFDSPDNEIFGERYTYAQINWIFNSFVVMFSPRTKTAEEFIQIITDIINQPTGAIPLEKYAQLGLPGLLIGGMQEIYSRPVASGVQSISESLATLDFTTPAKALGVQGGIGYSSLSGVQTLWKASRNMAYLLAIVLLIASGFLIMFRVKINPQTVVSLQTMIPKLIITLLLITFSYAIAGLVIDLVYVILVFILSLLALPGIGIITNAGAAIKIFTSGSYSVFVLYFLVPWLLLLFYSTVGGLVMLFTGQWQTLILSITGILPLISIIAMILIVWALIKVWWMLIKTYVTLLFQIIIGPWQIMLDLIPGQSGFTSWIRNIIANASVFIVVPIMFLFNLLLWKPYDNPLVNALLSKIYPLGSQGQASSVANFRMPLINTTGGIFNLVLGYAILALIPKVAEMIKDALKVPTFKYGAAFGEALEPVKTLGGAGLSYVSGREEALAKAGGSPADVAVHRVNQFLADLVRNKVAGK